MEFDHNWHGPEHLRPAVMRSQQEKDIWHACVVDNEYRLGHLNPDDVVIDIGCNIGGFSYLAHQMGSRKIYSFDCDENAIVAARANLPAEVDIFLARVDRSDYPKQIGLDQIIESFGPVRFLKIDCEGDEWPILYTSRLLDRIQEIAGEYHLSTSHAEHFEVSREALAAYLRQQGFHFVEVTTTDDPYLGLFFAKRDV